jgi:peroxiredoxin
MVPTTFLIDKRGIVVEKYFGEQDWTEPEMIKEIEALL